MSAVARAPKAESGPRAPRPERAVAAPAAGSGGGGGGAREPRAPRAAPEGGAPRGVPRAGGGGGGGGDRAPRERRERRDTAPPEEGTMRVKSTTNVKGFAGAMANRLRDKETFKVSGIGADSINQSVKAIIIARNYMVDEGLDCAISSAEVNSEVGPDALTFSVSLHAKTLDVACPEDNTFKCAATTKAPMLAGAIANRIREGAKHLSVTSVGPMAALRNIKAYCIAKTYLEEAGYDFYLVPFFVQVSVGEEDRTGIRLDAFVSKK